MLTPPRSGGGQVEAGPSGRPQGVGEPLDERKASILRAVVSEYIETAQPVGSAHVTRVPEVGVSAATIRNEMVALEHEGHRVTETADGTSGLNRDEMMRPDIVLIDIGLPGLDGYEVSSGIR